MEIKEFIIWDGTSNFDQVMQFMGENGGNKVAYEDYEAYCYKTGVIHVNTYIGRKEARKGDYIFKDGNGYDVYYPSRIKKLLNKIRNIHF